jgi:hypothetical protein
MIAASVRTGPEVQMKLEQLELADLLNGDSSHPEPQRVPTAREVLEELFELLEDYAPTWYTEEHHNRAVAALRGNEVPEGRRE